MLIGVPKEIKVREYRVGLVPANVRELVLHTGVFGAQLFELQLERVVSLMMAFADFDQPADIL